VRFALATAGASKLTIHDAAGRRVRTLSVTGSTAEWDGLDDRGVPVAAGTYFARTGTSEAVKIERLR
jgi:flagellar hook assembly protein FlgD